MKRLSKRLVVPLCALILLGGSTVAYAGHWPLDHEIETDPFDMSIARLRIHNTVTSQIETLALEGPTTIEVDLDSFGDKVDDKRKADLQDVDTEMVSLQLTGTATGPVLPPGVSVTVQVRPVNEHPFKLSLGFIEEKTNANPARLELPALDPNSSPPFLSPGETGEALSCFDVFPEIKIDYDNNGIIDLILHTHDFKQLCAQITQKPPAVGETYESPEDAPPVPLFDEQEQRTDFEIVAARHTPVPVPEFGLPIIFPIAVGFVLLTLRKLRIRLGIRRDDSK